MTRIILTSVMVGLCLTAGPVLAGGEVLVGPVTVATDAAGSSGGGMIVPILLLTLIAAIAAG